MQSASIEFLPCREGGGYLVTLISTPKAHMGQQVGRDGQMARGRPMAPHT